MSKHIAGKIFSTPQELGLEPLSADETAAAEQTLAKYHEQIEAVPLADRRPMSPKFWDDTKGTEFEDRAS